MLNFRKYNKKAVLVLILIILISCKENVSNFKLTFKSGIDFRDILFEKLFEVTHYKIKWCIPFSDKVICKISIDMRETEYKLVIYDYSGKIIKERKIRSGEAPDEITATLLGRIISVDNSEIVCIDTRDYVKSIDTNSLEVRTLAKVSNLIKGYGSKYVYSKATFTSVDRNGTTCVVAFESPGFWHDCKYYFVKFDRLFKNFRIISEAEQEEVKAEEKRIRKNVKKKISFVDYYYPLRAAKIFSVDWKRSFVYYIPTTERPIIEAVDFDGKNRKRFEIDIDFRKFKIEREKLELICKYFGTFSRDPILLNLKQICYIPPHAPPLQGIKVIGDWLLVITGNRDWEKGENQTLVYKLPQMEYEGECYIPFPNFVKPEWIDNYYITKDIVEENEDYYYALRIYRVKKR